MLHTTNGKEKNSIGSHQLGSSQCEIPVEKGVDVSELGRLRKAQSVTRAENANASTAAFPFAMEAPSNLAGLGLAG